MLALLLLFAPASCREHDAPRTTRVQPSALPGPSAAPPSSPAGRSDHAAEDVEIRGFIDAWQRAQNELRFDDYSALYADRFSGLKRVGDRVFQFDRGRWLADRKPMFRPGLRVEVSDLAIHRATAAATVTFVQHFSLPAYRDEGKKLLVIARTPAGRRIVREELLTSTIRGGGGTHPGLPGLFVATRDGVILRRIDHERWARGEPRRGSGIAADRALDLAALPAELAAARGRTFYVARAAAPAATEPPPACEARVAELVLRTSLTPYESTLSAWNGTGDVPKPPDAQIAREVWELGASVPARLVFGKFAEPCAGALFATDRPLPPRVTPTLASGALAQAATRAFQSSPAYRKAQASFLAETPNASGRWDEGSFGHRRVHRFGAPPGRAFVLVSAYREGSCAEFTGSSSALFELGADGAELTPLGVVEDGGRHPLTPRTAFDLDGDGALELLTGPDGLDEQIGVVRVSGRTARRELLHVVPFLGCGC